MDKVVTKVDPYQQKSTTDEELKNATENLSLNDDNAPVVAPTHETYPLEDGSTLLERKLPEEAVTSTTIAKETFIVRPADGDIFSTWLDVTHISMQDSKDEQQPGQIRSEAPRNRGDHESIVLDISGYKTNDDGQDDEEVADGKELLEEPDVLTADTPDTVVESPNPVNEPAEQQQQQQQKDDNAKSLWGWGSARRRSTTDSQESVDKIKLGEEEEGQLVSDFQLEPNKTYRIEMSLCGLSAFGSNEEENGKVFDQHKFTYDAFVHNPNILNDRRLVFRYEGKYYAAGHTGPLFTSLLLFRKPVEGSASTETEGKDSESGGLSDSRESYQFGRGWRQWWSRSSVAGQSSSSGSSNNQQKDTDTKTTFMTTTTTTSVGWNSNHTHPGEEAGGAELYPFPKKNYAKTLRLTSDQLKTLNLRKGVNTVTFTVQSEYQGTATCTAKIFFWDYDIQVVISDIDGTITKSDALGHVFTMIGKDWTHNGVAKLYTDIANNGYKILYLTSRAIGQADYTRDYLRRVEQNKYQLPDGPVIMSPDRLFTSLHREVIMRKPEVFKMACLRDMQRLFGGHNPFYAGFGNRITDAISYRSVDVPASRIFTIDPNGNVRLELLTGFLSSYIHLNDLVDQIFPPINKALDEEFSDWNYWKQPLPEIDIPELQEDAAPTPTSPKPIPIKPDPEASLPSYSIAESDAQKRRKQRGILRSFTSRSTTAESVSKFGSYYSSSSSPSLITRSGRTSPVSQSLADPSEGTSDQKTSNATITAAAPVAPCNDNNNNNNNNNESPLATSPPSPTSRTSPVPSSTSSSSSIVGKVITGGLGGVRSTLSRTFAPRKSSLSEESKNASDKHNKSEEEDQEAYDENLMLDDDDVDIDMDSIPFI